MLNELKSQLILKYSPAAKFEFSGCRLIVSTGRYGDSTKNGEPNEYEVSLDMHGNGDFDSYKIPQPGGYYSQPMLFGIKGAYKVDESVVRRLMNSVQKTLNKMQTFCEAEKKYNKLITSNASTAFNGGYGGYGGFYRIIERYGQDSQFSKKSFSKIWLFIDKQNRDEVYEFAKYFIKYPDLLNAHDIPNLILKEHDNVSVIDIWYQMATDFKNYNILDSIIAKIYVITDKNDLNSLGKLIKSFPNSDYAKKGIEDSYTTVNKKGNIAGYEWFIKKHPSSQQAKLAMNNIHRISFSKAKEINTLNAYNDFIIANPYSKQVDEANQKSYEFENKKYSGKFWSRKVEKNSRALLIQLKRIQRDMGAQGSKEGKTGYHLIVNRMQELLQDKFPAEEATLRYLESEEFKDFFENFTSTMNDMKEILNKISKNTSDLSSILQQQTNVLSRHLSASAKEQKMANFYAHEHQLWDRYIKKQET